MLFSMASKLRLHDLLSPVPAHTGFRVWQELLGTALLDGFTSLGGRIPSPRTSRGYHHVKLTSSSFLPHCTLSHHRKWYFGLSS